MINETPTIKFTMKLAGLYVTANVCYESTREFCKDFIVDMPCTNVQPNGETCTNAQPKGGNACDIEVTITPKLIDETEEINKIARERDGIYLSGERTFLETLALHKEIATKMVPYGITVFHSSSITIDGRGLMFTATSGTGKSTHTSIWKKCFGERVIHINDDKPFVRVEEGKLYVCGSPWMGKHGRGTNAEAEVSAIGIIKRDMENFVKKVPPAVAFATIYNQIYRPTGIDMTKATLDIAKFITENIPIYEVHCNMEDEAAINCYEGIFERP